MQINLESLGIKLSTVLNTSVKIRSKFQQGFLFKVFNPTSQQQFFLIIDYIFGKKKGMFVIYKSELQKTKLKRVH